MFVAARFMPSLPMEVRASLSSALSDPDRDPAASCPTAASLLQAAVRRHHRDAAAEQDVAARIAGLRLTSTELSPTGRPVTETSTKRAVANVAALAERDLWPALRLLGSDSTALLDGPALIEDALRGAAPEFQAWEMDHPPVTETDRTALRAKRQALDAEAWAHGRRILLDATRKVAQPLARVESDADTIVRAALARAASHTPQSRASKATDEEEEEEEEEEDVSVLNPHVAALVAAVESLSATDAVTVALQAAALGAIATYCRLILCLSARPFAQVGSAAEAVPLRPVDAAAVVPLAEAAVVVAWQLRLGDNPFVKATLEAAGAVKASDGTSAPLPPAAGSLWLNAVLFQSLFGSVPGTDYSALRMTMAPDRATVDRATERLDEAGLLDTAAVAEVGKLPKFLDEPVLDWVENPEETEALLVRHHHNLRFNRGKAHKAPCPQRLRLTFGAIAAACTLTPVPMTDAVRQSVGPGRTSPPTVLLPDAFTPLTAMAVFGRSCRTYGEALEKLRKEQEWKGGLMRPASASTADSSEASSPFRTAPATPAEVFASRPSTAQAPQGAKLPAPSRPTTAQSHHSAHRADTASVFIAVSRAVGITAAPVRAGAAQVPLPTHVARARYAALKWDTVTPTAFKEAETAWAAPAWAEHAPQPPALAPELQSSKHPGKGNATETVTAPTGQGAAPADLPPSLAALPADAAADAVASVADRFLRSGDPSTAATLYTRAIKADPLNPALYGGRCAALLSHESDPDALGSALEDADRAVELGPDRSVGHRCRAEVLFALDRFSDAAAAARRVLELSPGDGAATEVLQGCAQAAGTLPCGQTERATVHIIDAAAALAAADGPQPLRRSTDESFPTAMPWGTAATLDLADPTGTARPVCMASLHVPGRGGTVLAVGTSDQRLVFYDPSDAAALSGTPRGEPTSLPVLRPCHQVGDPLLSLSMCTGLRDGVVAVGPVVRLGRVFDSETGAPLNLRAPPAAEVKTGKVRSASELLAQARRNSRPPSPPKPTSPFVPFGKASTFGRDHAITASHMCAPPSGSLLVTAASGVVALWDVTRDEAPLFAASAAMAAGSGYGAAAVPGSDYGNVLTSSRLDRSPGVTALAESLEQELGLIAAGYDDGLVRLWDPRRPVSHGCALAAKIQAFSVLNFGGPEERAGLFPHAAPTSLAFAGRGLWVASSVAPAGGVACYAVPRPGCMTCGLMVPRGESTVPRRSGPPRAAELHRPEAEDELPRPQSPPRRSCVDIVNESRGGSPRSARSSSPRKRMQSISIVAAKAMGADPAGPRGAAAGPYAVQQPVFSAAQCPRLFEYERDRLPSTALHCPPARAVASRSLLFDAVHADAAEYRAETFPTGGVAPGVGFGGPVACMAPCFPFGPAGGPTMACTTTSGAVELRAVQALGAAL